MELPLEKLKVIKVADLRDEQLNELGEILSLLDAKIDLLPEHDLTFLSELFNSEQMKGDNANNEALSKIEAIVVSTQPAPQAIIQKEKTENERSKNHKEEKTRENAQFANRIKYFIEHAAKKASDKLEEAKDRKERKRMRADWIEFKHLSKDFAGCMALVEQMLEKHGLLDIAKDGTQVTKIAEAIKTISRSNRETAMESLSVLLEVTPAGDRKAVIAKLLVDRSHFDSRRLYADEELVKRRPEASLLMELALASPEDMEKFLQAFKVTPENAEHVKAILRRVEYSNRFEKVGRYLSHLESPEHMEFLAVMSRVDIFGKEVGLGKMGQAVDLMNRLGKSGDKMKFLLDNWNEICKLNSGWVKVDNNDTSGSTIVQFFQEFAKQDGSKEMKLIADSITADIKGDKEGKSLEYELVRQSNEKYLGAVLPNCFEVIKTYRQDSKQIPSGQQQSYDEFLSFIIQANFVHDYLYNERPVLTPTAELFQISSSFRKLAEPYTEKQFSLDLGTNILVPLAVLSQDNGAFARNIRFLRRKMESRPDDVIRLLINNLNDKEPTTLKELMKSNSSLSESKKKELSRITQESLRHTIRELILDEARETYQKNFVDQYNASDMVSRTPQELKANLAIDSDMVGTWEALNRRMDVTLERVEDDKALLASEITAIIDEMGLANAQIIFREGNPSERGTGVEGYFENRPEEKEYLQRKYSENRRAVLAIERVGAFAYDVGEGKPHTKSLSKEVSERLRVRLEKNGWSKQVVERLTAAVERDYETYERENGKTAMQFILVPGERALEATARLEASYFVQRLPKLHGGTMAKGRELQTNRDSVSIMARIADSCPSDSPLSVSPAITSGLSAVLIEEKGADAEKYAKAIARRGDSYMWDVVSLLDGFWKTRDLVKDDPIYASAFAKLKFKGVDEPKFERLLGIVRNVNGVNNRMVDANYPNPYQLLIALYGMDKLDLIENAMMALAKSSAGKRNSRGYEALLLGHVKSLVKHAEAPNFQKLCEKTVEVLRYDDKRWINIEKVIPSALVFCKNSGYDLELFERLITRVDSEIKEARLRGVELDSVSLCRLMEVEGMGIDDLFSVFELRKQLDRTSEIHGEENRKNATENMFPEFTKRYSEIGFANVAAEYTANSEADLDILASKLSEIRGKRLAGGFDEEGYAWTSSKLRFFAESVKKNPEASAAEIAEVMNKKFSKEPPASEGAISRKMAELKKKEVSVGLDKFGYLWTSEKLEKLSRVQKMYAPKDKNATLAEKRKGMEQMLEEFNGYFPGNNLPFYVLMPAVLVTADTDTLDLLRKVVRNKELKKNMHFRNLVAKSLFEVSKFEDREAAKNIVNEAVRTCAESKKGHAKTDAFAMFEKLDAFAGFNDPGAVSTLSKRIGEVGFRSPLEMAEFVKSEIVRLTLAKIDLTDSDLEKNGISRERVVHVVERTRLFEILGVLASSNRYRQGHGSLPLLKEIAIQFMKGENNYYRWRSEGAIGAEQLAALGKKAANAWKTSVPDTYADVKISDDDLGVFKHNAIMSALADFSGYFGATEEGKSISLTEVGRSKIIFDIEKLEDELKGIPDNDERRVLLEPRLEVLRNGRIVVEGFNGLKDRQYSSKMSSESIESINAELDNVMSAASSLGEHEAVDELINAKRLVSAPVQEFKPKNLMAEDSDDLFTLLAIGEVPRHSCQSYINGSYNECLPAYVADANKRAIVVSDIGGKKLGKIHSRAIIKAYAGTVDGEKRNIIILEPNYVDSSNPVYSELTLQHAMKKAQVTGAALVVNANIAAATDMLERNATVEGFEIRAAAKVVINSLESRNSGQYSDVFGVHGKEPFTKELMITTLIPPKIEAGAAFDSDPMESVAFNGKGASSEEKREFMSKMKVRSAEASDLMEIRRMYDICFPETKLTPSDMLSEEYMREKNPVYLMIEHEGRPIGFLLAQADGAKPDYTRLSYIGILPKMRKYGVGSTVITEYVRGSYDAGYRGIVGRFKEKNLKYYRRFADFVKGEEIIHQGKSFSTGEKGYTLEYTFPDRKKKKEQIREVVSSLS